MNGGMATVIRPGETSKTSPALLAGVGGIKLRNSRRALPIGGNDRDQSTGGERECLDYLGSGRAERSGR